MTIRRLLAIPILGLAVVALMPGASPAAGDRAVVTLVAGMNGAREVPGPGDRDGSGLAQLTVDAASGEICYSLTVRNIERATASHIHVAPRDESGPVVQGLVPPSDGTSSGCVVNAGLASALVADPAAYYVNVHNLPFAAGAVRGQLAGG